MFAVIKTGGKQYRVAAGDVINVEKLEAEAGGKVVFDTVLMHGEGDAVTVGTPFIEGAIVTGEVLEQFRGKKVVGLKKRRRKHSSARRWGHRQSLTKVKIAEVPGGASGSGAKPKEVAAVEASPGKPNNAVAGPVTDGDDLTKLPGMTEAGATALNQLGIFYFKQISEWGPADWGTVEDHIEQQAPDASISRASMLSQANSLLQAREAAAREPGE